MIGKKVIAQLVSLANVLDSENLFGEADTLTGIAKRLAFYGEPPIDPPDEPENPHYDNAMEAAMRMVQTIQQSPVYQQALTMDENDPQYEITWSQQLPGLIRSAVDVYNSQSPTELDPEEVVNLVLEDPESDLMPVIENKINMQLDEARQDQEFMHGYDD